MAFNPGSGVIKLGIKTAQLQLGAASAKVALNGVGRSGFKAAVGAGSASAGLIAAGGAAGFAGAAAAAAATAFTALNISMGAIGAIMIGIGIVVTALTAAFFALIKAFKVAASAEETLSKFKAVFKENAVAALAWGDDLSLAVNRSKAAIQESMATFQSLFTAMKFNSKESTEMSKSMTKLAIDMASFHDKTDEEFQINLLAALSGEGEAVKRFGIDITETALKAKLLELGLKGATSAATQQQKVLARMAIMLEATGDAQGDAEKTQGSAVNQMKALGATVANLAAEFGVVLLPVITDFIAALRGMLPAIRIFLPLLRLLVVPLKLIANAALIAGIAFTSFFGTKEELAALRESFAALNKDMKLDPKFSQDDMKKRIQDQFDKAGKSGISVNGKANLKVTAKFESIEDQSRRIQLALLNRDPVKEDNQTKMAKASENSAASLANIEELLQNQNALIGSERIQVGA